MVGNGEVCLRWFNRDPPDLREALEPRQTVIGGSNDGRLAVHPAAAS
jgi:hypothetical protein